MLSRQRARVEFPGLGARVGTLAEARTVIGKRDRTYEQRRFELDAGTVAWVDLASTPHTLLPDAVDEECHAAEGAACERLELKCCISMQRLTDPARGERCTHAANANHAALSQYVARCKSVPPLAATRRWRAAAAWCATSG